MKKAHVLGALHQKRRTGCYIFKGRLMGKQDGGRKRIMDIDNVKELIKLVYTICLKA